MKPLAVVVGAGGHARVVGASLRFLGIEIAAFVDPDFRARQGKNAEELIAGAPVVGSLENLARFPANEFDAYVALGDNARRKIAVEQLRAAGYAMPALIHPASRLNAGVVVGEASCICMGANLSAQVRIGEGVIVNTGAQIDHECEIGAFVHIAPGAAIAGRVSVGAGTFVGIGARVADGLSIGGGAIVGAGSVVLKDIPAGAKVLGIYH